MLDSEGFHRSKGVVILLCSSLKCGRCLTEAFSLLLLHLQDIIQQHLCCPSTVSLIEKCTRFHVHCAHHLCEEHISSFDAKINNENMTKCLQSLKEMYQDLAARQIFCAREAEFRQYSVLLKLNDGDILRSVIKTH